MFKTSTKITSLLIAYASMISIVPAEASDYKRIEDNDGTIYNGVAYGYGKFYIDGKINELGEGVYYLSDDKYIKLKEINSGDEIGLYGEKYLEIADGDSYLNLKTGKITNDDIKSDEKDDALIALKKKIRKDNDGRYLEDLDIENKNLTEIESNKFLSPWYYTYLEGNEAKEFLVLTDNDGNYIDADYSLGKISVCTKDLNNEDNKVTLENTSDENEGLIAGIYNEKILGQDDEFIYRSAYLTINYINNEENYNVTTSEGVTFGGYKNNNKVETIKIKRTVDGNEKEIYVIPVIQKISKKQSKDNIDGAKYPEKVETYFITGENGGKLEMDKMLGNYSIVNGKIISYSIDNEKLKAYSISLKSKNGYYYTDFSDKAEIDSDDIRDIETDVNGELWILESGFIKKFNNDDDFDKVYKVDGSMNEMSVYDSENILTWNEDDEVYSVITKKTLETSVEVKEENKVLDPWVENEDGTWCYLKEDGSKATGWVQSISSKLWYYMNADGIMVSNCWIKDNNKWYHFNENGAMQTGWTYIDKEWYYLESSGAMKTGWINDRGTWYYCSESGEMLHNTFVNGYYLGDNGAWTR